MALPLDLLEKALNTRMTLTLKDGRVMEGTLVGYDQYMNLVLEGAEEHGAGGDRTLGTIVLRGNNLVSIAQALSTGNKG